MFTDDVYDLARAMYERASLSGIHRTRTTWLELTPHERARWNNLALFSFTAVKELVVESLAKEGVLATPAAATAATATA